MTNNQNSDELEKLRHKVQELERLLDDRRNTENMLAIERDLGLALSGTSELGRGLELCLKAALEISGMECGGVYLVNESDGSLDLAFHTGLSSEFIETASHYDAGSDNAKLVLAGESIFTEHSKLVVSPASKNKQEGLRAIAVVPIMHEKKVIGSLNVSARSMDEVPLTARVGIETIATHIGATIARLRAERALERKIRELNSFLNNIPDMAWLKDADSNFIAANKAFGETVGMDPQYLVKNTCEVCFGQEVAAKFREDDKIVMETGKQITIEESIKDAYGNKVNLETVKSPIWGESGEVVGTVGVARDVTNRKKSEEREKQLRDLLSRAQRMESLGVLAGGIAHDLNNILGPMLALPDVVVADLDELSGGKDVDLSMIKEDVGVIKSSAKRAIATIRDLVVMGRRGNFARAPVDVNAVVKECLNTREIIGLCENSGPLSVDSNLWSTELIVEGSETHLLRVIANLVVNAVESLDVFDTSEPRRVVVATLRIQLSEPMAAYEIIDPGEYAVIGVSDTGQGIDERHVDRIFEPFFTNKKAGEKSGSGLGLSVVHGVVKDHGGFIDVKSAPGEGTEFSIYLPLAVGVSKEASIHPDNVVTGGNERILVADDEPGQRFLASRGLAKLGYSVTEASSGREAVSIFKRNFDVEGKPPFDLVLLDMIMEEDFDGLDALQEILKLNPEQRVIIVSGHAAEARGKAAQNLGADWLSKPYEIKELASAVRIKLNKLWD